MTLNNNLDDIKSCTVLVRCDFNIPSDIEDLTRIYAAKDTILQLVNSDCSVVLMSHYKRPSEDEAFTDKFSLRQIIPSIERVIGLPVNFIEGDIRKVSKKDIKHGVNLLENLRFYKEESKNDIDFAKTLATIADVYVNEAFSVAHRKHASVAAITEFLPSYPGYSFINEITNLRSVTSNIVRPYTAIIGGSKVSSKIDVLDAISQTADTLVVVGAMANTFLAAEGYDMKMSLVEYDYIEKAKSIVAGAKSKIVLPRDFMCSENIDKPGKCCRLKCIPDGYSCFDIGEKSINSIKMILSKSKTVLWNGAIGAFEFSNFNIGSREIAGFIADLTRKKRIKSVIGGGETVASIAEFKDDMSFVSTAGGAFLEFISGVDLPGVVALGL